MPFNSTDRTDPPHFCQLLDVLKETGRWRKGRFSLPMNSEVSERIHDRISFDKECWLIDGQEIQENRMIGMTA